MHRISAICCVCLLGISSIGVWSRPRLAASHGQCRHVVVVPWLLRGCAGAGMATAAVAIGNHIIASVVPWWGSSQDPGAEWRRREVRSTSRGLRTFPPGTGRRTDSLAQQVDNSQISIKRIWAEGKTRGLLVQKIGSTEKYRWRRYAQMMSQWNTISIAY